jgi:hypothetical protein
MGNNGRPHIGNSESIDNSLAGACECGWIRGLREPSRKTTTASAQAIKSLYALAATTIAFVATLTLLLGL